MAAVAFPSFAQLQGDGYYRVQSAKQGRYIRVIDNRGSVNVSTTSADMAALQTVLGFDRVVSDPGSVIYVKKLSSGYDLQSQGTGSYAITSYALKVTDIGDGCYWASASKAGMTLYLEDEPITAITSAAKRQTGSLMTTSNSKDLNDGWVDWYVKPVSANSDCYFGITPDVTAGGSYYKSFYAAFPFTFSSQGMNAYTVTMIDTKKAAVVVNELTSGVPTSVPVIVKCSSDQVANNKINVGASASSAVAGNLLKGVYFCNDVSNTAHRNVVDYNPSTMRVLGTAADGSLAFVKSSTLKYIPSNSAYITVSADAPDVLKVYTKAEYDALPSAAPGDLNEDGFIDVQDLGVVVQMIVGSLPKTAAADLNGDGEVDIQDLGIIVKLIVK